jgi:PKD domain-containing protein/FIMAH domain-containing protein/Big-like domain-containing protein
VKNSLRKLVEKRALVGALAALLPLAAAAPAHAAFNDSLDQSLVMTAWPAFQLNVPFMAQTFTPAITGRVDRVSLPVSSPFGFAMFTVSLTAVSDAAPTTGQPTPTVLGTAATSSGFFSCCAFRDFVFASPVPVSSGKQYAVVVQVLAGNLKWLDSGALDLYPGGREYIGGSLTTWGTTSHGDFGFKEWVATNVNQAPTVTTDRAALSYTEGSIATNTGSCFDADGDALTMTVTGGGTVSECTGGKWSWSLATQDEAAQQTINVTATDAGGLSASTSFTLDVAAVDPTAQILSDPPTVTVPEGTNVPFTGNATSPSTADTTAGFKYTWTVTLNTATYASGSGASFNFVPKDDGSYLVSFKATDDGGMSGSTSMTVIATNVAPNATITGVQSAGTLVTTPFETLSFAGSFTDADTADNYTMTWSFGDGSVSSGRNVTHYYSLPGTYTVKFQVSDGEGGVGQATTTVTVQTTQQALSSIEGYVQALPDLNAGQKNSLIVKLQNAAAAAARGDNNAASNELNAFLNELQADVNTGKVSQTAAGTLRTAVHAVQGSLGTFNRLVAWWPLEA